MHAKKRANFFKNTIFNLIERLEAKNSQSELIKFKVGNSKCKVLPMSLHFTLTILLKIRFENFDIFMSIISCFIFDNYLKLCDVVIFANYLYIILVSPLCTIKALFTQENL